MDIIPAAMAAEAMTPAQALAQDMANGTFTPISPTTGPKPVTLVPTAEGVGSKPYTPPADAEPKVTATSAQEKPAKASSPFKGGLSKAKAPEPTPAPAPAPEEAAPVDDVLSDVMDDSLDQISGEDLEREAAAPEEQVPEEEAPEPTPATTPKLGFNFRKAPEAVEQIEQPPATKPMSTFSKLHQRRPETAEAVEG